VATRDEVLEELAEVHKDLAAFKKSRDAIQERLLELEGTPRYETLAGWPATVAIWNVQILAIVRCEGLIEDYRKHLESLDVPDNVVPLLKEVTEENHNG
jgi:hypothetical protein